LASDSKEVVVGKLTSFLVGGALGAGLALLLAPRSGEETRALVAEKADECWGKGQTWYDQGKTRVQEGVAGVQPAINQKGDELREKIDNARTLIAEQVAKNAAAARDVINDKVPVAAEKINQAADVVRGRIDSAAGALKDKTAEVAAKDAVSPVAPVAGVPQAVGTADKLEPAAPVVAPEAAAPQAQ
jgi:gas vesicle protein